MSDQLMCTFPDHSDENEVSIKETLNILHKKDDAHLMMKFLSHFWKETENSATTMGKGNKSATWDPLILWVKPSYCCFNTISLHVKSFGLERIASIGCGSGLLEWLLWKVTGIEVSGYEVNRNWWESSYSPQVYIPHIYADEADELPRLDSSYALFSCYFNNGRVFRDYLSRYEGPLMIIIGSNNSSRVTDPYPLEFKDSPWWTLNGTHEMEGGDLIAFYTRNFSKRIL